MSAVYGADGVCGHVLYLKAELKHGGSSAVSHTSECSWADTLCDLGMLTSLIRSSKWRPKGGAIHSPSESLPQGHV